jgi:hypothetical protein
MVYKIFVVLTAFPILIAAPLVSKCPGHSMKILSSEDIE